MALSAFKRCGNGFRCSSRAPLGLTLYRQIVESNGGVYQDEEFSGPNVGRWFALAMMVSRSRMTLERAGNQANPLKLWDLLKAKEKTYALTPAATDTYADRLEAVSAAEQLALGSKRGNVIYQLQAALGSDFVAWVTELRSVGVDYAAHLPTGFTAAFPANPEQQGIFDNPASWKTIALDTVAYPGSRTIAWHHVSGDVDSPIVIGDQFVVAPGDLGQQELVTVTARTDTTFTAAFARPHEIGTQAIRRPWPFWLSNMKHSCVVVKNGRAKDLVLRQKVCGVLSKVLSAISTWDIVEENSSPGSAGPAIPGAWLLGQTPLKQVSY